MVRVELWPILPSRHLGFSVGAPSSHYGADDRFVSTIAIAVFIGDLARDFRLPLPQPLQTRSGNAFLRPLFTSLRNHMRREILRSSNTRPTAIVEHSKLTWLDFPLELQGQLHRALAHNSSTDLVLVVDHEGAPTTSFQLETRAECASWLNKDDLSDLARHVRCAPVGPGELLCLLIHPSDTGLRILTLADILQPESEPGPVWAVQGVA